MIIDKIVKLIDTIEDGIETISKLDLVVFSIITMVSVLCPVVPILIFISWISWRIYIARQYKHSINVLALESSSIVKIQEELMSIAAMEQCNKEFENEIDDLKLKTYTIYYQTSLNNPIVYVGDAHNSVEFLRNFLDAHLDIKCITRFELGGSDSNKY